MQHAIDTVNKQEMGWPRAPKDFGVPQATQASQEQNKNIHEVSERLFRFQGTFGQTLEREPVGHMKTSGVTFLCLHMHRIKKLAYQLVDRNEQNIH